MFSWLLLSRFVFFHGRNGRRDGEAWCASRLPCHTSTPVPVPVPVRVVHVPMRTHHAPRTEHHAPCTKHHAPRTTHHAPCAMHHAHAPCRSTRCLCLLIVQAADACTLAFGTSEYAQTLARLRLAHPEIAFASHLIVGIAHMTRPVSLASRQLVRAAISPRSVTVSPSSCPAVTLVSLSYLRPLTSYLVLPLTSSYPLPRLTPYLVLPRTSYLVLLLISYLVLPRTSHTRPGCVHRRARRSRLSYGSGSYPLHSGASATYATCQTALLPAAGSRSRQDARSPVHWGWAWCTSSCIAC